ncbi:MAG TPA: TRAFs-binding domain-containing protein [Vicinamibacterales bacterium]|jgi:class 3 adenylate cyclase
MSRIPQEQIALDAEGLLKAGAPLAAYDTLADGLRQFPDDVRMRQLLALALARSGSSRLANPILQQLVREGHRDEETTGMLARTYKDLWAASTDPAQRPAHLALAFRHYADAFEATRGYWSGINAATMALLLGNREQSKALAQAVREQCLQLDKSAGAGGDYWVAATLGESALLLESWNEAEDWYLRASILGRGKLGDIVSTRRNARLILSHLQTDATRVDRCFNVPLVVVFAGHLIDRPGRSTQRFPASMEPFVRDAIHRQLALLPPAIGYASPACGGDILFLEAMLEASAETHVVLPYGRERFRADSVDLGSSVDPEYWNGWSRRFDRVLEKATEVVTASEQPLGTGAASFEYGFRWLDGAAAVKADELETELVALALWDGLAGDGPGGTASSIEHWRRLRRRVVIVDLPKPDATADVVSGFSRTRANVDLATPDATPDVVSGFSRTDADKPTAFEPQIVGLLFADVRGFSALSDDEIPLFVERVLGAIADELSQVPRPPLIANTWGDGLYLVFDGIRETGEFALRLCERMRSADWRTMGFDHDLALRIGLHAGPAYAFQDPVTGRPNFIGAHVSRAARIEPITPPGEVYASQAFAALARSEGVQSFSCAYVGQTPMAKHYGTFPTYVIHPRTP